MADGIDTKYAFTVEGWPDDLLSVVSVEGKDALSSPYRFTVTVSSARKDFDFDSAVRRTARLRITGPGAEDGENAYSGVVFAWRYLSTREDILFFSAELVPRLALLSLTQHNQVFLNQNLPDILTSVFKECGLTEFSLRLQASYDAFEYVCQFNESSLDFVSRLMERDGLYYFFTETERGESLVVTDTLTAHEPIAGRALEYLPPTGLDSPERERKIVRLACERTVVPAKVMLRDYNYNHPNIDLAAEAVAAPDGQGVYYHYGDHFTTIADGQRLAKIRAEELLARQTVFRGSSTAPLLRAGALFSVERHPRDGYNTSYLAMEVVHSGRVQSPLTAGFGGIGGADSATKSHYGNEFAATFAKTQFRAARATPKSRFHGFLHANVDAEGDGKYALLDSAGRYKVRLPFDLAGRPAAQASHWLRLAEPYAGADMGMHFPLLKDTEVLLAFIDGDPDRPVIASAVHNAATPNIVKDKNNALSAIKTAGNNQLVMGDTEGQEFIGLYSPFHKSSILMGSTKSGGGGSLEFKTEGAMETFILGNENKAVVGTVNEATIGAKTEVMVGAQAAFTGGWKTEYTLGWHMDLKKGPGLEVGTESMSVFKEKAVAGYEKVTLRGGFHQNYVNELESLKNHYYGITAATMAGGLGATLATETFSEEGCWHDKGNGVNYGVGVTSGVLMLGSLVGLVAATKTLHSAMDTVINRPNPEWVSNLELDQHGFDGQVSRNRGGGLHALTKGVNLEVLSETGVAPQPPTIQHSSYFRIANDDEEIMVVNKEVPATAGQSAFLKITGGNNATLTAYGRGKLIVGANANAEAGVFITYGNDATNAIVSLKNNETILGVSATTKITATPNSIVIAGDNDNTISATNQGLVLRFGGGQMQAGTLKVEANTGKILLG